MIERLQDALKAEFTDVVLYLEQPSSFTAPSVVIAPGSPFLESDTMGMVTERWRVLIVANKAAQDMGVATMRRLSLKARRAVSSVGAVWEGTNQPEVAQDDTKAYAILTNNVRFRYQPEDVLDDDESSS